MRLMISLLVTSPAARLAPLLLAAALAAALADGPPPARADTSPPGAYRVLNLGTLGGPLSRAYGLNEVGDVVGEAQDASGRWRAFLWRDGRMTDLGTLGGAESVAYAVNDQGQVVGRAATDQTTQYGEPIYHAFLWEDGVMRDLGTLGGTMSAAYGINTAGQVVGGSELGPGRGPTRAFRWEAGEMRDLGSLAGTHGQSTALDINDQGQVVGWTDTGRVAGNPDYPIFGVSVSTACLWHEGRLTDLDAALSEENDFYAGAASSIDATGRAVGWIRRGAFTFPRVWLPGAAGALLPHDSRSMSLVAQASSDGGLIVGSTRHVVLSGRDVTPLSARYWLGDGPARPLDDQLAPTGWTLNDARAVNTRGEVAGIADAAISSRAFLISPVSVRAAGTADLTGELASAASRPHGGTGRSFHATLSVRNAGTSAAPATAARWFASDHSTLSDGSPVYLGQSDIPALGPGETYQLDVSLPVPEEYRDRDYLLVELDGDHRVNEADETNNDDTAGPFPMLDAIDLPFGGVRGGRSVTGTIYLTGPAQQPTTVTLVSSGRLASVPRRVTVRPGSASARFRVRTRPVSRRRTVKITAELGGLQKEFELIIDPRRAAGNRIQR